MSVFGSFLRKKDHAMYLNVQGVKKLSDDYIYDKLMSIMRFPEDDNIERIIVANKVVYLVRFFSEEHLGYSSKLEISRRNDKLPIAVWDIHKSIGEWVTYDILGVPNIHLVDISTDKSSDICNNIDPEFTVSKQRTFKMVENSIKYIYNVRYDKAKLKYIVNEIYKPFEHCL